jgi:hypothetical protein
MHNGSHQKHSSLPGYLYGAIRFILVKTKRTRSGDCDDGVTGEPNVTLASDAFHPKTDHSERENRFNISTPRDRSTEQQLLVFSFVASYTPNTIIAQHGQCVCVPFFSHLLMVVVVLVASSSSSPRCCYFFFASATMYIRTGSTFVDSEMLNSL